MTILGVTVPDHSFNEAAAMTPRKTELNWRLGSGDPGFNEAAAMTPRKNARSSSCWSVPGSCFNEAAAMTPRKKPADGTVGARAQRASMRPRR